MSLTSHLMKTLERIVLPYLRSMVGRMMDPLQFAYLSHVGVEDAIIFLLHRAYSHLEKAGSKVRSMFFDFLSAFNSIEPGLLRDKVISADMEVPSVTWIMDYLTERPQNVRLQNY